MKIIHHGAAKGVTGSCHQLETPWGSVLIDCGLFQGQDKKYQPSSGFGFSPKDISLMVLTHVHIDHVGRLPELVASGFDGPIYCTHATAALLPEVIDDALRVGIKLGYASRESLLEKIEAQVVAVDYGQECSPAELANNVSIVFRVAGHILGSAFVEVRTAQSSVLFSGDLGAKNTPLLPDVAMPGHCDVMVVESTYGGRNHEDRSNRIERLKRAVDRSLQNKGTTIIPAFSIGRTQELLYEFEQIFAQRDPSWKRLPIIVDSPLAVRFTKIYEQFKVLWDSEAKHITRNQRHPLSFHNLVCINEFKDHVQILNRLKQREESAIVIAAGGMCEGGRVIDFLRELLPLESTDVLFVGYQAEGTLGRAILSGQSPVTIDEESVEVSAQVSALGGYSAHADEDGLMEFVLSMEPPPRHVRIIHGEPQAQGDFARRIRRELPNVEVSLAAQQHELEIGTPANGS